MNQTNIIYILSIVILVQFVIIIKTYSKKESFTEVDSKFSDDLVSLLKTKPSYVQYLTFLIENKNKSSNLVIKSNYDKLLEEVEKGTVSKESIVNLM